MIIPFTPSNTAAPPFQVTVTLDGNAYSMTTMWSAYRGDWMVQLYDSTGALFSNMPLIGSPPNYGIPLFAGLFTTSVVIFYQASQQFVISP